jgi:5-formyltetrahydrofolate cyclo-ligase
LSEEVFLNAKVLALYSEIHNEVSTGAVAERALELDKTLVYPRVKEEELEFVVVRDLDELTSGAFGVLEPQGQEVLSPAVLDLVVVPGVVFDRKGHRLGYGRGYYDRVLSVCSQGCSKVGFAYDFQLVEKLPSVGHDEELSMLITEENVLNFHV